MKITLELDDLTADALARVDRAIGHNSRRLDPNNPEHHRSLRGYQARTARRLFEEALFCVLDAAEDDTAHPSRPARIDPLGGLRFSLDVGRRQPCRSYEHAQACEAAERAIREAAQPPADESDDTAAPAARPARSMRPSETETLTVNGSSIEVPRALIDAARQRAASCGMSLEDLLAHLIARDNPQR